jgi:methylated-DNA-[protein]-cysteine S-methyltransferase
LIRFARLETPIGELVLTASDTALTGVYFPRRVPPVSEWVPRDNDILERTKDQLGEYFARRRTTFDVPLEPTGTSFEQKVWKQLRVIPYGVTISYGELAKRVGPRTEPRAVGAANGKNPLPIVVPCHRVIGATGELVGFGGGIERKRWLLTHEGALLL